MNGDDQNLRDAVWRLARSVDSLVVNGVTACATQWKTAGGFVKDLVRRSRTALQAVAEEAAKSSNGDGRAGTSVRLAQDGLTRMDEIFADLVQFKAALPERIRSRSADLTEQYHQLQATVRNLEAACHLTPSFYTSPPTDAANRIDALLRSLPGVFLDAAGERASQSPAS